MSDNIWMARRRSAMRLWLEVLALSLIALVCALSGAAGEGIQPIGEVYVYKRTSERELRLFVVRPVEWAQADRRPAVVFFHGGAWAGGEPSQFNQHSAYFASR